MGNVQTGRRKPDVLERLNFGGKVTLRKTKLMQKVTPTPTETLVCGFCSPWRGFGRWKNRRYAKCLYELNYNFGAILLNKTHISLLCPRDAPTLSFSKKSWWFLKEDRLKMTVQLVNSLDYLLYPCFVLYKTKQISLLQFY